MTVTRWTKVPWLPLTLTALVLVSGVICARAALGRTSSWSFPIDDAYIYSNYALNAAHGAVLQYNPGEPSGGVTSASWFLLLWAVYPLTAPLGGWLIGLAPQMVQQADPALAATAGRLYLTAYILGAVLLALAGMATARLAARCHGSALGPWAGGAGASAGLVLLTDPQAVWGAFSGLELALSLALVPGALLALLADATRAGGPRLRGSLLLAALLPWARPELSVVAAAGLVWLGGMALRRPSGVGWRQVAAYAGAAGGGLLMLAGFYLGFTGRPLPSSFYAKVSGLRLGPKLLAPFTEWTLAGHWQPFVLLTLAALGALVLLIWRTGPGSGTDKQEPTPITQSAIVLVGLAAAAFLAAMTLTLPWFGQEDRYVLPAHPLLIVLALGGLALVAGWLWRHIPVAYRSLAGVGMGLVLLLLLGARLLDLRVWAAEAYALDVQNIEDGHVAPARWLAAHAPPGVPVAAEPIGAVRLFSRHPTVDVIGLTTPAFLGTYGDWAATAAGLQEHGARYFLFYPAAWPDGQPLSWAHEVARFPIRANRITGGDVIAVYELHW